MELSVPLFQIVLPLLEFVSLGLQLLKTVAAEALAVRQRLLDALMRGLGLSVGLACWPVVGLKGRLDILACRWLWVRCWRHFVVQIGHASAAQESVVPRQAGRWLRALLAFHPPLLL